MREEQQIRNENEDKQTIHKPVILVTVLLVILIGIMIWFGLKEPKIFSNIRDFIITFTVFIMFLIWILVAVLCIFLTSRLKDGKVKLDQVLSNADSTIVDIGEKVEGILVDILNPIMDTMSKSAGIMHILSILNSKGK